MSGTQQVLYSTGCYYRCYCYAVFLYVTSEGVSYLVLNKTLYLLLIIKTKYASEEYLADKVLRKLSRATAKCPRDLAGMKEMAKVSVPCVPLSQCDDNQSIYHRKPCSKWVLATKRTTEETPNVQDAVQVQEHAAVNRGKQQRI